MAPCGARGAPAAPHPVSGLEPNSSPGKSLAHGQPLHLGDAPQEPAPRAHAAHPSDGPKSDRPWLELSGVHLASGAYRSSSHQADGRTDGTATDSSSPGATWEQNTCADSCRERGSSSATSCVRDQLLFSKTTDIYAVAIGKLHWYAATMWRCCSITPGWRGGFREVLRARHDEGGHYRHGLHPSSHVPQGHQCTLSKPRCADQA
jgi:hypothetical protein